MGLSHSAGIPWGLESRACAYIWHGNMYALLFVLDSVWYVSCDVGSRSEDMGKMRGNVHGSEKELWIGIVDALWWHTVFSKQMACDRKI
jgi:hypothetical protein